MKSYEKMNRKERRKAICKDVIKQIHIGKMNIKRNNVYFIIKKSNMPSIGYNDRNITTDEAKRIQNKCTCCAMGALMISKIAKFDNVSFDQLGLRNYSDKSLNASSMRIEDILEEAFSHDELHEIEDAFECSDIDPYDKLLEICQNIIDHGSFKPEVEYEIVEV